MVYGYKFLYKDEQTFYKELSRLESATNMVISNDNQKKYKYWQPKIEQDLNMSYSDAIEGTKHYLLKVSNYV